MREPGEKSTNSSSDQVRQGAACERGTGTKLFDNGYDGYAFYANDDDDDNDQDINSRVCRFHSLSVA